MNFTGYAEAHEPPPRRDGVRMLVGRPTSISHHEFTELPSLVDAGDVLVVNTSATMPAALPVDGEDGLMLHVSTQLDDGRWLVELRSSHQPHRGPVPAFLVLKGGATVHFDDSFTDRLRVATFDVPSLPEYLWEHGFPIRYSYVERDFPIADYQTVFSSFEGGFASAEMPSAARPFTSELVTRLVSRGVLFAPVVLHTGVASPEAHEKPYPERFSVPAATARLVNFARSSGGRVIAVGTTSVRALESAASPDGTVTAASGWTDLVVTPSRGVYSVDGLLTGFHEPRASHLMMLEAIAGRTLLEACYHAALANNYLWHEFGDLNLFLPH